MAAGADTRRFFPSTPGSIGPHDEHLIESFVVDILYQKESNHYLSELLSTYPRWKFILNSPVVQSMAYGQDGANTKSVTGSW